LGARGGEGDEAGVSRVGEAEVLEGGAVGRV
jgi:hypothetical protein